MRLKVKIIILALFCLGLSGWDYSKHSIPLKDIQSGGPPKDGIPAIDNPQFVSAAIADRTFLKNSDRVLTLVLGGKKKAYPIKILNWHEIVNDKLAGRNVVVTFCPLCGTGMVFDRNIAGREMDFGVSGLLYQSDVLLYDRQTESLWSQIKMQAVAGSMTGTRMELLAATHTTWGAWKKKHPETMVLSTKTGYDRNYQRDPYLGYYKSEDIMFGVANTSRRYHPKEQVIGIRIGRFAKAYPFSELSRVKSPVSDRIGKKKIRIHFDEASRTAVIRDEKGKDLPTVVGFWFAWYAFHPKTLVFTAD